MTALFGADEAGRGPVLGSLFAAAVVVTDDTVLPDGIDDSKRLSPSRREELADALRAGERIATAVAEIPPERIDDPAADMNALCVEAQARAIDAAIDAASERADDDRAAIDEVTGIVDACDVNEDRFARRVRDQLSFDVDLTAEHGADENHSIVGAASVLAKVARDAHVDALATEYGPVGSGYPSDPATRTFLAEYVAEHGDLPECARRSWSTCADVLAAAEQSGLADF